MLSPVAWALVGLFTVLGFAAIVVQNTRREIARRERIERRRGEIAARQHVAREHSRKLREERRRDQSGG